MAEEEDLKRFIRSYLEIGDCIRLTDFSDSEKSRKFHALLKMKDFERHNGKQMTISEISRDTGIAMPNVSRFLRPLEEAGYIERQRIGRSVYMHITADGDQMLAARFDEMSVYFSEMLDVLTDEEKSCYLSCSEKISAALMNIVEKNRTGDYDVQTLQKP